MRLANAHSLNLKPQTHEPRNQSQTQSSPRNGLHPADRLPRHRLLRQIHLRTPNQLNLKTDDTSRMRRIGYDILRIYFDNADKDCTIGQQRIKRIITI